MSFQIHSLPAEPFRDLFTLTEEELVARSMTRMVVKTSPGSPCRVSMTDAEVGETVILLNYQHQPAKSPYQATHAIFIREGAQQKHLSPGEVPDVIRRRLISLRLFDEQHMMIDSDVMPGDQIAQAIDDAFKNQSVAYAHLHNAKPGCFAASVTRAK